MIGRYRWLVPLGALVCASQFASADNFAAVRFDQKTDQLVVTMAYRGTNPNHNFSLQWGECLADQSGGLPEVTVEVLDDQGKDAEQEAFQKTISFDLSGLPCARPATVSLRTAPRFFYTLTIP